ncbi:MAG TPA: electron transport complex subunit RsxC [Candidatus Scybalocola faecavium]|nr:electron transport complex subunit RsxC [Candidatus Scybalocola faecavium]
MANHSNGLLGKLGIVRSPGAAVPHRKHTSDVETVDMPVPAMVSICMQQHIGAPCIPVVKPGQEVFVGQVIGDSDQYISAPIHSSVSGKVKKIDTLIMPNGAKAQTVIIETDGKQTADPSIMPPVINSHEDLIKAVRASGLVGLGGAGFPTHVKLKPQTKDGIDTLIINAAECEPYITADVREIIENSWDVMSGIYTVSELLGVKHALIAIEDNKPEAIKIMENIASKDDGHGDIVQVRVLPSRYPQGAEKVLINACTGRQVPPGKLPADVGVVVMNVASVATLSRYLKTGMPLVTKRLTIDGSAIKEPKNVRVPIGALVKDVIEFCGGYKEPPAKLLYGGPMMGTALSDDQMPVMKQNNAILAFNRQEAESLEPGPCIRCGRCVNACPMSLMPTKLEQASIHNKVEDLKKYNVNVCMECGCCSYVCPANRRLVQSIRVGKVILRNSGKQVK